MPLLRDTAPLAHQRDYLMILLVHLLMAHLKVHHMAPQGHLPGLRDHSRHPHNHTSRLPEADHGDPHRAAGTPWKGSWSPLPRQTAAPAARLAPGQERSRRLREVEKED